MSRRLSGTGNTRDGDDPVETKAFRIPSGLKPPRMMRDYIAVRKLIEKEKETPGGIILPPSSDNVPQVAEVMFTGPGDIHKSGKLIPIDFKPGDIVVHAQYVGDDTIEYNGDVLYMMKEAAVFAVLDADDAEEVKARFKA